MDAISTFFMILISLNDVFFVLMITHFASYVELSPVTTKNPEHQLLPTEHIFHASDSSTTRAVVSSSREYTRALESELTFLSHVSERVISSNVYSGINGTM